MTALFISVFLFFLSVALIWTNRQDIALSLSMEHKLKAQSAARSVAYEAFARLREYGELGGFNEKSFPNGASASIELLSKEPFGKRGPVMLIRAKGKSGPLTSYLTLHLNDARIAGTSNQDESRVLVFPSAVSAEPEERAAEEQEQTGTEEVSLWSGLYGNFILEDVAKPSPGAVASGGPMFAPEVVEQEAPFFSAVIPVFSEDRQSLSAWGLTYLALPRYNKLDGITRLGELVYANDKLDWKDIDPPTELGDPDPILDQENTSAYVIDKLELKDWTTVSVQGIFDATNHYLWKVDKPLSDDAQEISEHFDSGEPSITGPTKDWTSVRAQAQEKFVTRGAIAAQGKSVYSHGWHYVYVPYSGSIPSNLGYQHGARVVRWPCILKYESGGAWSKVWSALGENGMVRSENRPDPNVLVVTDAGKVYSVTEPVEGASRRLLAITGTTDSKLEDEVPPGKLLAYQDKLYVIRADQQPPGMVELGQEKGIGFDSLPSRIPEIFGDVVDTTGTETMVIGLEGGYSGEALKSESRLTVTARPQVDLSYTLSSVGEVAVDGLDLWAIMTINVDISDPTYYKAYLDPPFSKGPHQTLARYDGERWNILPGGLRAAIGSRGTSLAAPGAGVVAAVYPGLPKQVNRYTVISEDTNPF